ncbi:MAG: class II D-tagatose-bisphosphate aldolase, non-catalytic subunit [Dehalococcoidia bacterium]|nr:class II D-tagatose-bisphosphate aldolase, non-catalytic subunit [Dehalococcoidia bacterium]
MAADVSHLRRMAARSGFTLCDAIIRSFSHLSVKEGEPWRTLLAVSANSQAVVEAALLAAGQANCPIFFVATLNQVDIDGGYTGWNHARFVTKIRQTARQTGFKGPILLGVDHAGPWLRDRHTTEKWTYRRTMSAVKRSLESAIKAGFDLLHIDPTVDRELLPGRALHLDTIIERTVLLIKHCESFRIKHELPPVSYEVGTEEVKGGLADENMFSGFLAGLRKVMTEEGLSHAWPCFIVGKVGTDLDTTVFSLQVAQDLSSIARDYGLVLKGHYTDNVENPSAYPASKMGGANVGPEFTEVECDALFELESREKSTPDGIVAKPSLFEESLRQAVIRSGRWQKWLHAEEAGKPFDALPAIRQSWLLKTGARYMWTDRQVVEARKRLYANLAKDGFDPHHYVVERISQQILKYCRAFNLYDTIPALEKEFNRRSRLPFWDEGQVLTAGELIVEIMRPSVDMPLDKTGRFTGPFPSGAPAIFANASARVGKRTGFVGSLGQDGFGRLLLRRFTNDEVDIKLIASVKGRPTGCAFVAYDWDGGRNFIFHIAGTASDRLPSITRAVKYAQSFRHLHLMGCSLSISRSIRDVCMAMAEAVKQAGGSVSLDPNLRPELLSAEECRNILLPVVRLADIVLPSGNEAGLLVHEQDTDTACRRLIESGVKIVVLKKGDSGCRVFTSESSFDVPGFNVNAVDPTGAGDCFDAGFISGYLDHLPLYETARLANAMGALAASRMGPMEGTFSLPEVLSFIKSQSKA